MAALHELASELRTHTRTQQEDGASQPLSKAGWRMKLSACFEGLSPEAAKQWQHGSFDRAAAATGPLYVRAFEDSVEKKGGERRGGA